MNIKPRVVFVAYIKLISIIKALNIKPRVVFVFRWELPFFLHMRTRLNLLNNGCPNILKTNFEHVFKERNVAYGTFTIYLEIGFVRIPLITIKTHRLPPFHVLVYNLTLTYDNV